MDQFLGIALRWFHVIAACVAIGGAVFIRFILPAGLKLLESEQQKAVYLRCRRVFKMMVHTCILLLLLSGTYNAIANWQKYKLVMPTSHMFFGLHVLLGLAVFTISLILLAGKEPPPMHKKWMAVNVVLMMLVVAAASSLKWVRDHAPVVTPSAQGE
jgi:uncharacterized membrane protein